MTFRAVESGGLRSAAPHPAGFTCGAAGHRLLNSIEVSSEFGHRVVGTTVANLPLSNPQKRGFGIGPGPGPGISLSGAALRHCRVV
jgi:hypothetical protein